MYLGNHALSPWVSTQTSDLTERNPTTPSGSQHRQGKKAGTSEMKLELYITPLLARLSRCPLRGAALTAASHLSATFPRHNSRGLSQAMSASHFCSSGYVSHNVNVPLSTAHASSCFEPRGADIEGSNILLAEYSGEWDTLPARMAFCSCESCNEPQNL